MSDLSMRNLRIGLLIAFCLHLLILGLYLFDVIPQDFHNPTSRFWLHHGGDDYDYVRLANDISHLEFSANKYPIGFPVLLLPFVALIGPEHDDLLPAAAIFWGVFMFPVGQWLVAFIAGQITGKRWIALLSALLWTILPLVVYILCAIVSNAVVAETYSVHLTWFHMLSDGPGTLFTLLAAAVWLRLRQSPRPVYWALLLGALLGYLFLIRYTGVLMAGVIGLPLLLERRWREIAAMSLALLIVASPQLVYNAHFFNSPLSTGYTVLDDLPEHNLFSPHYVIDGIQDAGLKRQIIGGMGIVFIVGFSGLALRRINRPYALLLALWITSYSVIYGIYYYSWTGGFTRFMMPIYPALAILAAVLVHTAFASLQRNPERSRG